MHKKVLNTRLSAKVESWQLLVLLGIMLPLAFYSDSTGEGRLLVKYRLGLLGGLD